MRSLPRTGRYPLIAGLVAALVVHGCGEAPRNDGPAVEARAESADRSSRAPGRPAASLRILSYNIRHGEGFDSTVNLKRVARLIRRLDADVVALQEVDSFVERSFGVDQAAVLGSLTGMNALFGGFFDYQGGRYGMAILSRYPIISQQNETLPEGAEPRTALAVRTRLQPDGPELTVVGIHLYATDEERYVQAQRIIELFGDFDEPVVLAGDFNSTRESRVMAVLRDHFTVPLKADEGLTFPAREPEREIDYILFRPDHRFRVLDHEVMDERLISDHRPVILDVIIE
ncbi:MAG: metallophosphoesterase [Gemmatimonadetes bacterium]|uniref:Metallophosphoesterase n=1 Tax=Candidatus Kutchimonas denitrificans TaxID=3056748 RepID=A0AAE5CCB8_9BACT|nr:metallophosphoesterase [Gemmatimonadota bacterium]NIR73964.1 metallophosphoesterase [Candidatus Kutchimonas denitrificans]NIS02953.1 metallophosphoesterase [Gemmatimonadota bacterium]NIT68670.1 metallophosphoesterase [Gemmatimonadota bacterium]NIU53251.1 metallophosphoesterase [Gemmatimonadota bacterium]